MALVYRPSLVVSSLMPKNARFTRLLPSNTINFMEKPPE